MIHPSGTFFCTATVPDLQKLSSELTMQAREHNSGKTLVGQNPTLTLTGDRISLSAASKTGAYCYVVSFPIGDAVQSLIQPGDYLCLIRDLSAHFGLSVLRAGKLIIALGAVTIVDLGSALAASNQPPWGEDTSSPETWVRFQHGDSTWDVGPRQSAKIGSYYVYVELGWTPGFDSLQEVAVVSSAKRTELHLSAMRSAILLGNVGRPEFPNMLPWTVTS